MENGSDKEAGALAPADALPLALGQRCGLCTVCLFSRTGKCLAANAAALAARRERQRLTDAVRTNRRRREERLRRPERGTRTPGPGGSVCSLCRSGAHYAPRCPLRRVLCAPSEEEPAADDDARWAAGLSAEVRAMLLATKQLASARLHELPDDADFATRCRGLTTAQLRSLEGALMRLVEVPTLPAPQPSQPGSPG